MTKLNNGHSLPLVGLGTYSLKGQICIDAVYGAIRLGYRLIDTAHMYGNEREVGIAVRRAVADGLASREEIAVATKLYPDQYARPASAIEESLAKLDLGWCDIMLLHHPGRDDVAAYRAMEDHAGRGLIRSLGLSCFYQAELDAFLPQVRVKPVLVQNEIHPYYQDRQNTLHIQSQGIAVQAWYPLGGRGRQRELFADPVLQDIASRHGKTAAQVMLRWNVQNGVAVIPGSSSPSHQAENLDIFGFELTASEMAPASSNVHAETAPGRGAMHPLWRKTVAPGVSCLQALSWVMARTPWACEAVRQGWQLHEKTRLRSLVVRPGRGGRCRRGLGTLARLQGGDDGRRQHLPGILCLYGH